MKLEIDFPFHGYTKGDLIKFCFGEHANVDTAIPIEYIKQLYELTNSYGAQHWYVMDYTEHKAFGKLVNLKEKFFAVIAEKALQQLPKNLAEELALEKKDLNPFKFELKHDNGTQNIIVLARNVVIARKIIRETEGCPDSAIKEIRA